MFFSGKSKQLPYLSEYLTYAVQQRNQNSSMAGFWGGLLGSMGGFMGAAIGLLAAFGLIRFSAAGLVGAIIAANLIAWLLVLAVWLGNRQKAKPKTEEERIQEEAGPVIKAMFGSMQRRRLHREVPTPVADLLEGAARNWSRTTGALSGPFWTNEALPAHWKAIRQQSLTAANTGMAEMLLLLGPCFKPDPNRSNWHDVVEEVVEEYVTGPSRRRMSVDHLPVGYDQAREIAEKLKLVASEVEKATREAYEDDSAQAYKSGTSLDVALSELRTIQAAEEELRLNTRG